MAKTVSLSEVKARLPELVAGVQEREEEVVVTKSGRPAAILINVMSTLASKRPWMSSAIRRSWVRLPRAGRFTGANTKGCHLRTCSASLLRP
jgi:prevent-host-death family protein